MSGANITYDKTTASLLSRMQSYLTKSRDQRLPWLSLLLSVILTPIGIILSVHHSSDTAIFIANLLALVPLSALLKHSIRDIVWWLQLCPPHLKNGYLLGGFIECILGNCPELIFSVVSLSRRETLVVQTAFIGALLSNSLLILGICLILGGWNRDIENFPRLMAKTNAQMLMIALGSLVMPAAYVTWSNTGKANLVPLSRGAAIVLLILYVCYFWFFYGSHPTFGGVNDRTTETGIVIPAVIGAAMLNKTIAEQMLKHHRERVATKNIKFKPLTAVVTSILAAVGSAICSLNLIKVIDASSRDLYISKSFLGLIILPFVLGLVDNIIAAAHARRQEMDWTIQTSIVSSIRIALFVLPVTICVAWALHIETMTLFFDGFQITLVFLTVVLMNHIFAGHGAEGGKWVEGAMLLAMYGLLIDAAWFYPNDV